MFEPEEIGPHFPLPPWLSPLRPYFQLILANQEKLLTMTADETAAIQALSDEIDKIITDATALFNAGAAAQQAKDALQEAIDRKADQDTIAALQAAANQESANVLAALAPLQAKLQGLDTSILAQEGVTASGTVTDAATPPAPLAGITITDSAGGSTTTAVDGTYSLKGLGVGSNLMPSAPNTTFVPPSLTLSAQPTQTGLDFVGTVTAPGP